MEPAGPRRVVLVSCPRTASNLLVRIFNLQKQTKLETPPPQGGYYFLPSIMKSNELGIRQKHLREWTEEERSQMQQEYQTGFDNFQNYVNNAEKNGKIAFIKEHAVMFTGPTDICNAMFPNDKIKEDRWLLKMTNSGDEAPMQSSLNETMLPDQFLKTLLPVFLVRHPALAFPSFERQMARLSTIIIGVDRRAQMSFKWSRSMYNYYADLLGRSDDAGEDDTTWPLVLEADDIMKHPEVVIRLAELMGMDKETLQFSWDKATKEQMEKMPEAMATMLGTLHHSDGINKDNVSEDIDIDVEAKKWKVEFGEEVGTEIEQLVRDAMPDYEFFKTKRLRPAGTTNSSV